jgi:hypothetical protein
MADKNLADLEGVIKMEDYDCAYLRRLENGKTVYLIAQMFNYRLAIGWTHEEETGYDDFYCYTNEFIAVMAFLHWTGEGDPLDGWIRHGASGRRRTEGDPESEYIQA